MKATIGNATIEGTPQEVLDLLAIITAEEAETNGGKPSPRCPVCRISMEVQNGKFGAFYGCPNYWSTPRCRCKRNLDGSLKGETLEILRQRRKEKTQRNGGASLSKKRAGWRRRAIFEAITREWQTRKKICREANKILKARD